MGNAGRERKARVYLTAQKACVLKPATRIPGSHRSLTHEICSASDTRRHRRTRGRANEAGILSLLSLSIGAEAFVSKLWQPARPAVASRPFRDCWKAARRFVAENRFIGVVPRETMEVSVSPRPEEESVNVERARAKSRATLRRVRVASLFLDSYGKGCAAF